MSDSQMAIVDAPRKAHRLCPNAKLSQRHAIEMQLVLHEIVTSKAGKPLELASCARAWSDLEERKRILRGKPLPGAFKPVAPPAKRKADAVIMGD